MMSAAEETAVETDADDQLRQEFMAFDVDGTGYITFAELKEVKLWLYSLYIRPNTHILPIFCLKPPLLYLFSCPKFTFS